MFETGLLLAGPGDPAHVRRQLSRWVRAGRVQQLRRGLYALAPPLAKTHPPSLPGGEPARTGLLRQRPLGPGLRPCHSRVRRRGDQRHRPASARPQAALGTVFVPPSESRASVRLSAGGPGREDQQAFVAAPEKALLDAVHLQPGGDDEAYLRELRLDFDVLCMDTLGAFAARCATPKLCAGGPTRPRAGRSPAGVRDAVKDHLRALVRGCEPLRGRNVVREYLQARILGALQRAGAMTSLAFQGGTCLRFLFALPRYSEDLHFTLEGDPSRYALRRHLQAVRTELSAEQYRVELRVREHRAVHSAVVRFPACCTSLVCLWS